MVALVVQCRRGAQATPPSGRHGGISETFSLTQVNAPCPRIGLSLSNTARQEGNNHDTHRWTTLPARDDILRSRQRCGGCCGGPGMMGGYWNTGTYLNALKAQLAISPDEEPAWKEDADTVSGVGEQMQVCTKPCSSRWAPPHGRSAGI